MDHPETPLRQRDRLPDWLKKNRDLSALHSIRATLRSSGLSTVCEEARCPNICECFQRPTSTFLILGDMCTRNCSFCSVSKGIPGPIDLTEPLNVAKAVRAMRLEHVVITSVARDDLQDEGASGFAATIRAVKELTPTCTTEVLTPDFSGREELLEIVLSENPDVFGHNIEMAGRLYPVMRPSSSMETSLHVLRNIKRISKDTLVKSGFMVGLGESESEIEELLKVLGDAGCDVITIGQYLRPTIAQVEVARYWGPEHYEGWSNLAKSLGIGYCVAGPFVRSSYRAGEVLKEIRNARYTG